MVRGPRRAEHSPGTTAQSPDAQKCVGDSANEPSESPGFHGRESRRAPEEELTGRDGLAVGPEGQSGHVRDPDSSVKIQPQLPKEQNDVRELRHAAARQLIWDVRVNAFRKDVPVDAYLSH